MVLALVISVGYTVFRKRVFDIWEAVLAAEVTGALTRVPRRVWRTLDTDSGDHDG